MIYGLIEVEPKMNRKKVIITVLIAVLIIAAIGFCVFYHINKDKFKNMSEKTNTVPEEKVVASSETKNEKSKHIAKVNFNPVYTDIGKALRNNIYHSEEKVVYLTFDDGPSKTVTPLLLDLLKQENIKATFFVLGARADLNPDILRREYKEGHFIANHGYSHIYGNIYATPEAVLEEYNKTKQTISRILETDYDGHLFRFPGGSTGGKYKNIKAQAKNILDENNIAYIDWNSLSSDAAGAKTKEAIIENTKQTVGNKNSVVILMHDAGDKILTYEALPEIISYLREQGYTFKNFYSIIK
ncbi:MAG: polysaccharide deacetylase [Clostridia bacterium]|nr:polysaccharide deacetylase [Clostridia bacterium]